MTVRRILVTLSLVVGLASIAAGSSTPSLAADRAPTLTNLAHLDWLGDTTRPTRRDTPPTGSPPSQSSACSGRTPSHATVC
jgi:hypothetical protein